MPLAYISNKILTVLTCCYFFYSDNREERALLQATVFIEDAIEVCRSLCYYRHY